MDYSVLERVRGGLIVSCQALKEEPLYSSYIMSRMAYAAKEGGAVGIRANTVADIVEIKKTVDLPVIGIIKEVYGDCDVYITHEGSRCACGVRRGYYCHGLHQPHQTGWKDSGRVLRRSTRQISGSAFYGRLFLL